MGKPSQAELRRYMDSMLRARQKFLAPSRKEFKLGMKRQLEQQMEFVMQGSFETAISLKAPKAPMLEAYDKVYTMVGVPFAKNAAKPKKAAFDKDYWIHYFEQYVREECGQLITWITNTTQEQFVRIVQEVMALQPVEGLSIGEMQRMIKERIGFMEDYRAERIARTEIVTASNYAQQSAVIEVFGEDDGIKTWISVIDDRTRGSNTGDEFDHLSMDGTSVGVHDTYDIDGESATMPGDPSLSAGNRINCRCCEIYSYKEPQFDFTPME